MEHELDGLWRSTSSMYKRFFRGGVTDFEFVRRHLFDAFSEYVADVYADTQMETSVNEAANLLHANIAMLLWLGFSLEQFKTALRAATLRVDARTLDTHFVDDKGRIERIPPVDPDDVDDEDDDEAGDTESLSADVLSGNDTATIAGNMPEIDTIQPSIATIPDSSIEDSHSERIKPY